MPRRSPAFLLLILLLLSAATTKATHIAGGEIYYECLGGNQYRITMMVYRDCAGQNLSNSYSLSVQSPCGNRSVTVSTNGGTEISQLCQAQMAQSTCHSNGSLPGMQEYVYTGVVTLPPCDYWTISWTDTYRNGAIANLVTPGNKNIYTEARINNVDGPCQESPRFTNAAIPYVCAGYPISYSYGAYDPAGDSLTYTFINARNVGAVDLPYVPPFSGTEPITGITLDPHTGQVNFTLNQVGNWVVVVRVDRYDHNGVWIGSIMRDMQFIAYPCTNIPPDPTTGLVSNLSGQAWQTGPRAIRICESGNFCFDAVIGDPNSGDVLTVTSNLAQNLPGATLTTVGTNPLTVRVCWTGTPGASGFFPFIITANDGACPIPALQTYVYSVQVLPGLLTAAPTVVDESCTGNQDGSATVDITVGTPPFQYEWSTGATTPSITAPAGNYTLVITDGNGCIAGPLAVTIGEANQPSTANAGPDLVGCMGALPVALSGSVTNAPGGIWSGGDGTLSGTGLNVSYMPTPSEVAAGGLHLVLSTTGESPCGVATDTVFIALPNSFAGSSISATDLLCNGSATGSATVTTTMAGLGFLWNDPSAQTTATATDLPAGTYSVLVTDNSGCDTTLTATIAQPAALAIANLQVTDEQCAGNADGTITAIVTGGTPPYAYSWSNGQTTATLHGPAGTYTLTVTDANNCTTAQASATITALGQPNAANAGADLIGCFSSLPVQLNGTVTNATSGQWGGGNGQFSGTGLNVTYMPTVAEIMANGVSLVLTTTGNPTCPPATDTVHITLPTSFFGSSVSHTNATCNGTATGSATFTPATPGLTFQWTPSGQGTANATGLPAGDHNLLVTDAYGCDTTFSVTISEPAALAVASLQVTHEQCAGNADGSIVATVTGGTQPYQYAWSNGQTGSTLNGPAGTYTLTVTDANNCAAAQGTATITALGQPNAANAGADLIGCFSSLPVQLNGTVTNATSGQWGGGNGQFSGTGLNVTYMPTVAEIMANGVSLVLTTTGNPTCPPATDTVHITLPTSFFGSSITPTHLSCHGDGSGAIAFLPANNSFSYSWNDAAGQQSATATGLSAGTYSVLVTDEHGCDTTATATITEPAPLTVNIQPNAPSCHGGANGSAMGQPAGGTPGYSYQWSANTNSQTGSSAYSLTAGAYTVVVTDSHGCQVQGAVTLPDPTPVLLTAQVEDTVCVNVPVPLTAQAAGGAGNYQITWAGIGTGDSLQYSFPATQVVTVSVTDQNGCNGPIVELPVTVLNLALATLNTYGDTAFCPGGTATVGAWVTGYPGQTSLSWPQIPATGSGPFHITAQASRSLTVTATDICANTIQRSVNIAVETPPTITLPPVIAQGCAPLTVHFPTGLTNQPVSYFWNFGNGATSTSMSPVHTYTAGNYNVSLTVTTPLGCSANAANTGAVHAFAPPVAAFTANPWETDADHANIQFIDQSTGTVNSWQWSFGDGAMSLDPSPYHHFEEPGVWTVGLTVTDDHGCTANVGHTVKVNPIYDITIPNVFTPNPNGGGNGFYDPSDLSNDVFYPFIRFVKNFRMRIFNRWGELVFESDDIRRGWDGYYRGQLSQQDVYVYQVWVRFVDNKEMQRTGDLTLFR